MVGCIKKHVIKHFQFPKKLSNKPVLRDVLQDVPTSSNTALEVNNAVKVVATYNQKKLLFM